MDKAVIAKVQNFGFDVYMRNESDTYLLFTDGARIGYLQDDRFGFYITTVHTPNTNTGTGFQMIRHAGNFSKEDLESGFSHAPAWASNDAISSVKKYKNIEEYRNANTFNQEYKLVDPVESKI